MAQARAITQETKDALSDLLIPVVIKLWGRIGDFLIQLWKAVQQYGGTLDVFARALTETERIQQCARILTAPKPVAIGGETIQIPDEAFTVFKERVRRWCNEHNISPDFLNTDPEKWKVLHSTVRGRAFEIRTYACRHEWHLRIDGRWIQGQQGFDGDPVILWYWIMENNSFKLLGTIPNEDDRLFCHEGHPRYAAFFDGFRSRFSLETVLYENEGWHEEAHTRPPGNRNTLIAFRPVVRSEPVISA